jgi:hypothetical protein
MDRGWSRWRRFVRRNRSLVAVAVVSSLLASGTAAATSYLVLGAANTSSKSTTLTSSVNASVLRITNTNSTGGTSARGLSIAVPAGREPIVVNSTAGKATNLDADKLDGRDSGDFGRVRSFAVGTNTVSDYTQVIAFNGLTLNRRSFLSGSDLVCAMYGTSPDGGRIDVVVAGATGASAVGMATPSGNGSVGIASPSNPQIVATLVFVDSATHHVTTAVYSIYELPGNAGCMWQGTVSAAP